LGWIGFGLKVLNLYDNGDNSWLSNINIKGEWYIAYHATLLSNVRPIILNGFRAGPSQLRSNDININPLSNGEFPRCGNGVYLSPYIKEDEIIVNVAKGIEEDTLLRLSQVINEEIPAAQVAVLSGPSHAEEVGKMMPTTVVVGAETKALAKKVQDTFMTDKFRVYTSPDMIGIELGGALKNVIALAAGIADGLGCGDNTKAALITRGIHEMSALGIAMGGKAETFSGLSGTGDLIVTCASQHSRNRKAGYLMGQGKTYQEAMDIVKMVVEGVYSAKAALALALKYDIEMPIVENVNKILFEDYPAKDALHDLLTRDRKKEASTLTWRE
jgi:glycerol-3-phosphate dehydrogenase (NAD(P)+)